VPGSIEDEKPQGKKIKWSDQKFTHRMLDQYVSVPLSFLRLSVP
jgi:hypothetical protein